jgi:hypothetical protein
VVCEGCRSDDGDGERKRGCEDGEREEDLHFCLRQTKAGRPAGCWVGLATQFHKTALPLLARLLSFLEVSRTRSWYKAGASESATGGRVEWLRKADAHGSAALFLVLCLCFTYMMLKLGLFSSTPFLHLAMLSKQQLDDSPLPALFLHLYAQLQHLEATPASMTICARQ